MNRNHAFNRTPVQAFYLANASGGGPVNLVSLGRTSQMSASARIVGWLWFVVPLLLLAYLVWDGAHSEFVGFAYYVVGWGGLLTVALCGHGSSSVRPAQNGFSALQRSSSLCLSGLMA